MLNPLYQLSEALRWPSLAHEVEQAMLLTIEYPITYVGRPGKARIDRTVVAKDVVTVDVPEFGAHEVTAVFDFVHLSDRLGAERFCECEGRLYGDVPEVDLKRGRLPFVYACNYGRTKTSILLPALQTMDEAIRNSDHERPLFPPSVGKAYERRSDQLFWNIEVPSFEEVGGTFDAGEIESQRLAFAEHADRFIVVDGRLMRSELEPAIAVRLSGMGWSIGVDLVRREMNGGSSVGDAFVSDLIPPTMFRIDQLEEAREFAAELAGLSGMGGPVKVECGIISSTSYAPDLLTFDPVGANLVAAARWLIRTVGAT